MESYVVFKESKKDAVYKEMLPQLRSLLEGEQDAIANLSNTVAVLKMAFPAAISWVGFYFRRGRELVLGPFQGKPACVRIGAEEDTDRSRCECLSGAYLL